MKKLFPIFILSLLAFVGCSDDDDKSIPLDESVVQFVESKYPGSKIRHSEYDDNGLIEVEIVHDARIKDVYFNTKNEWVYTSWDVKLTELPAVVKNAVVAAYPEFTIDDVDFVERGDEAFYEVELDKRGADIFVYVTPEGEILESSGGVPGGKPVVTDAMRAFIDEKYPGAVIEDFGYNANGLFEIDILHENVEKDVYFDADGNWVETSWDVAESYLPDAVNQALAKAYPEYIVDDADYVERPEIIYYEIELQKGSVEIVVYVTPEGEVLAN